MATAIDTLKIYERLKKANLGDEAAKEIVIVYCGLELRFGFNDSM